MVYTQPVNQDLPSVSCFENPTVIGGLSFRDVKASGTAGTYLVIERNIELFVRWSPRKMLAKHVSSPGPFC